MELRQSRPLLSMQPRPSQRTLPQQQKIRQIVLIRENEEGERWELPPLAESHGTRTLLTRINSLLGQRTGVFVVDEIDRSLHPRVTAAIVGLFTSPGANLNGLQLLFSAHDEGLMEYLRRDEVVFVEKGMDGSASVTSAADYREIRARDSLQEWYRQGRIGGVPIVGSLQLPSMEAG